MWRCGLEIFPIILKFPTAMEKLTACNVISWFCMMFQNWWSCTDYYRIVYTVAYIPRTFTVSWFTTKKALTRSLLDWPISFALDLVSSLYLLWTSFPSPLARLNGFNGSRSLIDIIERKNIDSLCLSFSLSNASWRLIIDIFLTCYHILTYIHRRHMTYMFICLWNW